jgi:protein SCO1
MTAQRALICLIAAGMLCAALLQAPAPALADTSDDATQKYPAFGLVLAIEGAHTLSVSCKEIPGFMDAMVMHIDVPDSKQLKNIQPGALIDFTLVAGEKSTYAENIRIHRFESPDQRQLEVQTLKIVTGASDAKSDAAILPVGQKVPDFNLIDQHHRPLRFSELSGKVVALSFVYTRCSFPEYCLRLSNNLGLVGKRFSSQLDKDLVLLTITFDPTNDSPEVLAKYAQTWKASAKGWYFLTGPSDDVKRVCLMFGMNFWPDMGMLAHSMHTAVIDRKGILVANLEGNEFSAEQLGDLLETEIARKP